MEIKIHYSKNVGEPNREKEAEEEMFLFFLSKKLLTDYRSMIIQLCATATYFIHDVVSEMRYNT